MILAVDSTAKQHT